MALIAQRIDVGHVQEPRILRTMRCVASQTTLSLDCGMFEDEWPACLRVALGANRILIGRGFDVVVPKGAMRVVAIGTFDQALVDSVVKGHIETGFDIRVALKAEGRLTYLEQRSLRSGLMHRVAADAAHIGLGVRGAKKIRMSGRMAAEARSVYGLGVCCCKIQDLCLIAARLDVRLARSVTTLASDALASMFERKFCMRT